MGGGFGVWGLGFGFWVLGLGFWVLGFEFCVSLYLKYRERRKFIQSLKYLMGAAGVRVGRGEGGERSSRAQKRR